MTNPEKTPDHEADPSAIDSLAAAQSPSATEEQLLAKIAALEEHYAQDKDRMMRALAEAENTRRRAIKDREDAIKFATAGFARDLLGFADNFGRALAAIPEDLKAAGDTRIDSLLSGLEAMERELTGVFERHKITKLIPLDQPFDPNFHEVIFEAPIPGKPAGIIIEVVEPGYVLHDRLLRPARVGIAKGDPAAKPQEPGSRVDTQA